MDGYVMTLPEGMTASFRGRLLAAIDAEKCERLISMQRLEDADLSLIADTMVRFIAMRRFGLRNRDIRFTAGPWGKPAFAGLQPFQFNCSHAGNRVFIVASPFQVGCDIEVIGSVDMDMARLVLAAEEFHALLQTAEEQRSALFYNLWTRKESYVKATGEGLSDTLHHYSVLGECVDGASSWRLRSYGRVEGYALAICTEKDEFAGTIEHVDAMGMLLSFLNMAECER